MGNIIMIITRLHGEMLVSHSIRTYRMGIGNCFEKYISPYFQKIGSTHPSMSLPVPRSSALDTVDDARLIEMYEDATAWPLLGLLEGFDLQELFLRPPFRRRRVPPRAYAEETLRFCATCAREQRNADAVSWWMRDLNLPLVAVCPIHHTPLYIA